MSVYRRGAGIAAVALTTVLLCAGCLGLAPSASTGEPAPDETGSPSAVDATVQQVADEKLPRGVEDGEVVATGALSSPDGTVSGAIRIVSMGGGDYNAEFDNMSITRDGLLAVGFSVEPWDEQTYCDEAYAVWSYGDTDLSSNPTMEFWFAQLMPEDPSFLDTVVLTQGIREQGDPGCFYPVVATAPLEWTMPDQRPDLAPADSGETGGARGPVELVDGVPTIYTVAPNDLIEEVAARFGITMDDLFYLNPGRDQNPMMEIGDVFNLSKTAR